MVFVLGIDGGGTKTVCVLMDHTGQVLGRGEGAASNYQSIGIETACESIHTSISQAVIAATPFLDNTGFFHIDGICLGLAGVGRAEDVAEVRSLLERLLAVRWNLQPAATLICNDCAIALVGGVGEPVGVVTVAGTGAIAYGENRQGKRKRSSGWGYILGDEGGAYDIALQGLKAAVRGYDGRSRPTSLTKKVIQKLQLSNVENLIEVIYRRGWGVKEIAGLAPLVSEAAAEGDIMANQIIDSAVNELVLATGVVTEVLFEAQEQFKIVTIGGVWGGIPALRDRFVDKMAIIAPFAEVIWPNFEPAVGAGLLALRGIGGS